MPDGKDKEIKSHLNQSGEEEKRIQKCNALLKVGKETRFVSKENDREAKENTLNTKVKQMVFNICLVRGKVSQVRIRKR